MKALCSAGWLALVIFSLCIVLLCPPACASPKVYVIDVHGTVWPGQATFVKDKLDEAARNGASAVILDVDTFGGLAASAVDIKDAIFSHDRDFITVGYVHNRALSSGSLITLACKYIAMAPGASLGSAQVHPSDPESMSWAHSEFTSTAEARGRNPNIASAWVTALAPVPSLGVKEGDILTLTTEEAQKNGYCDVVAAGYPDILTFLKLPSAVLVPEHMDFLESAALLVANPWVTILLLVIGAVLVIWEMMTLHSWGIAGAIGGVILAIVFLAHIIAGTAGWIGILLLIGGAVLILLETHVMPTHGLLLLAGTLLAAVGLFFALGGDRQNALFPATSSLVLIVAIMVGGLFYLPKSRIWKVLGLPNKQRATAGYVSSADYRGYLGAIGTTISLLRPSGIAEFDGARLDVVSSGDFIPANTSVEVFHIEGSKVVVRRTGTGQSQ
jgi:membrane-bound serine protease (ClpP class)